MAQSYAGTLQLGVAGAAALGRTLPRRAQPAAAAPPPCAGAPVTLRGLRLRASAPSASPDEVRADLPQLTRHGLAALVVGADSGCALAALASAAPSQSAASGATARTVGLAGAVARAQAPPRAFSGTLYSGCACAAGTARAHGILRPLAARPTQRPGAAALARLFALHASDARSPLTLSHGSGRLPALRCASHAHHRPGDWPSAGRLRRRRGGAGEVRPGH